MSAKRSDSEKSPVLVCLDPDEIFPLYWEADDALDVSSGFNGLYQSATFSSFSEQENGLNSEENLAFAATPNGLFLGSPEGHSLFITLHDTTVGG